MILEQIPILTEARHPIKEKKLPETQKAWNDVDSALKAVDQAGIFKKTAADWEKEPAISGETGKRTELAAALAEVGEDAGKCVKIFSDFDLAIRSNIVRVTDRKIDADQTLAGRDIIDKTAAEYPAAIRGLNLVISATEGKTDSASETLCKQAKNALAEIENNIDVIIAINGGGIEHGNYPVWKQKLHDRARGNWLAENQSKKTEDFDNLPEMTKTAYRHLTEKQAEKEIGKVGYQLVYAPDKEPEMPEATEVMENAEKIADSYVQAVIGEAITHLDETGLDKKIKGNPVFSQLVKWREIYKNTTDPKQRLMIASYITDAARTMMKFQPELEINPGIRGAAELLERNEYFYNSGGNNVGRGFLKERFAQTSFQVQGRDIDMDNYHAGNLTMAMIILRPLARADAANFSPAHRQSGEPSKVSLCIPKLVEAGLINGYEAEWLSFIDQHSTSESIVDQQQRLFAQSIGLGDTQGPNSQEIENPHVANMLHLNKYLVENATRIVDDIYGGTANVPPRAREAFPPLVNFTDKDLAEFEKKGFWSFGMTIGVLLGVTMVQSILEFDGNDPQGPQQGHP